MTEEELRKLARGHDWYYQYSDDHRVWRRGSESADRLRAAFKGHPDQDMAERVWNETSPESFRPYKRPE